MTCAQYQTALHELVDGTLGPIRSAELRTHLDRCEACRALLDDLQRIRDLAGALDRPVPPAGVWLQIAGQLRQEGRLNPAARHDRPASRSMARHPYTLVAIAAALVLAIGASLAMLVPLLRDSRDPAAGSSAQAGGNAAPGRTVQEDIEAEFRLAEQHYQAAIAKLEEATRSDTDVIDAPTAAMIQQNLQVIDQAIAESRAAVRSEPSSAPARDSLFGALRRKVALLQDTIALMNEMRKGNAAGAARLGDRIDSKG